jgi:antitoxin YefM
MDAVSYSKARAELAKLMDRVCDDCGPTIVTRRNGKNVVIISKSDYDSLEETAHLMRSPRSAGRLTEAIESLDATNWDQVFEGADEARRRRAIGDDAA